MNRPNPPASPRDVALSRYADAMGRAAHAQARAHEAKTTAAWNAYHAAMKDLEAARAVVEATP